LIPARTPLFHFYSVHVFYYFGHKNGDNFGKMNQFISQFQILSTGEEVYESAKKIQQGVDFEDTLQVATALTNGASEIITLDEKLSKCYKKLLEIRLV